MSLAITCRVGDITGRLREGAEERIMASFPCGRTPGRRVIVEEVTIRYRLEDEPTPKVAPVNGC